MTKYLVRLCQPNAGGARLGPDDVKWGARSRGVAGRRRCRATYVSWGMEEGASERPAVTARGAQPAPAPRWRDLPGPIAVVIAMVVAGGVTGHPTEQVRLDGEHADGHHDQPDDHLAVETASHHSAPPTGNSSKMGGDAKRTGSREEHNDYSVS